MRKNINDMFPLEICNMIKLDSNDMQSRENVDLVKLIELGIIKVVGVLDDSLLYQRAEIEEG